MAPTLIGLFGCGKMLPPQLNLVLELDFADAGDALRPARGTSNFSIENVRVLASQVQLDSSLVESFNKVLLSGRSLTFSYPTMNTQVSSVPAGATTHNATVARAFTKLDPGQRFPALHARSADAARLAAVPAESPHKPRRNAPLPRHHVWV